MAALDFNMSEVETDERTQSRELLPTGDYVMHVASTDVKRTKRGDGSFLTVCFEILRGPHARRKIWTNFTLTNPNADAERIGRQQLKSLATAVGKPNLTDSDQLLEIDFVGTVGVEKGSAGYEPRNNVKAFKALRAEAPKAAAPAPAPAKAKVADVSKKDDMNDSIDDLLGVGPKKAPWE